MRTDFSRGEQVTGLSAGHEDAAGEVAAVGEALGDEPHGTVAGGPGHG